MCTVKVVIPVVSSGSKANVGYGSIHYNAKVTVVTFETYESNTGYVTTGCVATIGSKDVAVETKCSTSEVCGQR